MIVLTSLLVLSNAFANPPPRASVPPRTRVYIPEDADPCELDRFRASPMLAQWIQNVSPNTATSARCYHTPVKLLPVVSGLMRDLDANKWSAKLGDEQIDLRAAALLGYRLDSLIDVTKDGRRSLGVILKQGVNGAVAAVVYEH